MKHYSAVTCYADRDTLDMVAAVGGEFPITGMLDNEASLVLYFDEGNFTDQTLDELRSWLPEGVDVEFEVGTVEEQNWNAVWEESFQPVIVDGFCGVRAHFHQPIPGVAHEIVITPKMSFGTGHHATTHLMIQQMRSIDFTGKKVLDFGTGTGILAILADKMGAQNVLAIDYDEWSITNTMENLIQNSSQNVKVEKYDAVPVNENFDIVLANINLNVIMSNLDAIVKVSKPGAQILLSGFLEENEGEMGAALEQSGLEHLYSAVKGDWVVMVAKKL